MIDVHSHIIPGVDDGSRSLEESVTMLRSLAAQGFDGVIATPHYSRRVALTDLPERAASVEDAIRQYVPGFCVWYGQETIWHEGLPEQLAAGRAFSINNTRYVLIEFDPEERAAVIIRAIRRLREEGYIPVIAHVERFVAFRDETMFAEAGEYGAVFQMNFESLSGSFFDRELRRCRRLVTEGLIQLLGTDMHRTDFRPPDTRGALSWLRAHVDHGYIDEMTVLNPVQLLKDQPVVRR